MKEPKEIRRGGDSNSRAETAIDLEAITFREYRNFKAWLHHKNNGFEHTTAIVQYNTKYFRDYKLTNPKDLMNYLDSIEGSYRYCVLAVRAYLNFLLEMNSVSESRIQPFLRILKMNGRTQVDNYIPSDEEILRSFHNITDDRIRLFYEVLTFSGIRITELYKVLTEFDPNRLITAGKNTGGPNKRLC